MATLPTISVQMAFNSGAPVGPFSDRTTWVWYDVTNYVRHFTTTLGRQHELDRTEAATMNLTLDNRDGRFTPWNTTTYSWSNVAGGTATLAPSAIEFVTVPVQITATWNSTTYPVWFGFVDAWNPKSPDALNQETDVTCSDIFRQLSQRRLSNATLYPNRVLADLPLVSSQQLAVYLRCNEPSTAISLANSITTDPAGYAASWIGSVNGKAAYQQPGAIAYDPNHSIDLGQQGSQAIAFISLADFSTSFGKTITDYAIEGWYQNASIGDYLMANYLPASSTLIGVKVGDNGKAEIWKTVFGSSTSTDTQLTGNNGGADLTDKAWHLVTLGSVSGTLTLYVDGAVVGTVASGLSDNLRTVSWGAWAAGNTTNGVLPYASTTAVVGELVATTDPTGTFASASSGRYPRGNYLRNPNQTPGNRLLQIMKIVGVVSTSGTKTTAPLNLASGYTYCADETGSVIGQTALDYALQIADTEAGFLYQDPTGTIQFRNRFYPQENAGTGLTLSDGATADGRYMLGVDVVLDDLDTWNIAQMTSPDGSVVEVTADTSVALYGPRTFTLSSVWANTKNAITALGQMITTRFATPKTRVTRIVLENTYTDPAGNLANIPIMLGLDLWDSLTLVRSGSASTALSASVVVEHIEHTYDAETASWQTAFTLSPYEMNYGPATNNGSVFRLSDGSTNFSRFGARVTTAVTLTTSAGTTVTLYPDGGKTTDLCWPLTGTPPTSPLVITHNGTSYTVSFTGTTNGIGGSQLNNATIASGSVALSVGDPVNRVLSTGQDSFGG